MADDAVYAPISMAVNPLLEGSGISIGECYSNTKASEYYVAVTFKQDDGFEWKTVVPYIYRRSGLCLDNDEDVVEYLKSIKKYFTKEAMASWKQTELKRWDDAAEKREDKDSLVTIEFFKQLLSFKTEVEMPKNPNPQRRLQTIKDQGYTVAIYPVGNKKWGKSYSLFR